MNPLAEHELGEWRATFPGIPPKEVKDLLERFQTGRDTAMADYARLYKATQVLKESRAAAVEQDQLSRIEANRLRGELERATEKLCKLAQPEKQIRDWIDNAKALQKQVNEWEPERKRLLAIIARAKEAGLVETHGETT